MNGLGVAEGVIFVGITCHLAKSSNCFMGVVQHLGCHVLEAIVDSECYMCDNESMNLLYLLFITHGQVR